MMMMIDVDDDNDENLLKNNFQMLFNK